MSGLYLVRSNRRIDEGAIVVEARPGVSRGTLHRLVLGARRVREIEVEAHDATAAPELGGQLHRWEVSDLDAGVYVARTVSEALAEVEVYFEITNAELRRDFGGDRRRAEREARRRG